MINRNQNETFIEYCQQLTQALQNKEISYSEWGNAIAGNTTYGDESLRRASTVFSMFLKRLIDEGITDISDKEILNNIERKQKELLKERKKLQTENLTYQANLRNDARGEMLMKKYWKPLSVYQSLIYHLLGLIKRIVGQLVYYVYLMPIMVRI